MRYRAFGRTGLEISAMGFGCWPMAGDRYGSIEEQDAVAAVRRAFDYGVNCFDTAPAYGAGHSEEMLARALGERRKDVILVTKCGIVPFHPGRTASSRDSSRDGIRAEVEVSLKRLQTDYTDVLLVHWPDPVTPLDETMRALDEIVESGKARFVGVSNFTVDQVRECMKVRRVDVVQVGYHIFDRRQEAEMFPYCLENGIAVMGYGSLAHGLLSGAFTHDTTFDPSDWRAGGVAFGQPIFRGDNFTANVAVAQSLNKEIAEPRGVSLSQVALSWVLGNPALSTALVGARTPAEVEANVNGVELELSAAERVRIDEIAAGVAGRVREFTPFRGATEQWGEELAPIG
jgi:aryl-alcohol dehydrogenase-like predicted oxidoreductase